MSNHFSADNLKFPGDDRRLDFTDLFIFKSSDNPDKTVLIIDSNPTSAPPPIPAPVTGPEFYPGAVYRINIDTDGDLQPDVAFTFVFSEYENGRQTGTAWYATGSEARPVIGVWATISRRRDDGTLEQLDRGGHPTINPFINPDGEKNLYNSRQPADDVANYLGPWSTILENGGYSPEAAQTAALMVLPDILRYDRTEPATYPNGRILTDDVYSIRFAWLSNGRIPPSGLQPHDNLLAELPYLGPPSP